MPQDQFGVKIYPGNRVVIDKPQGILSGIVSHIDEGKVALADHQGSQQRPGHITVLVDIHIMFDPNSDGTIGALVVTSSQPDIDKAEFERPKTKLVV